MSDLRGARLRFNPRFRLTPFDTLEAADRRALESLSDEPDFYGVLAPPATSALPIKSVSRDAALLFYTLREPARVPHLLTTLFGANAEPHVRQLILDGVLEIESEGRFLSGAAAFHHDAAVVETGTTHVARLSHAALEYAAAFQELSVREIAARLYMYNRAPSTPALQRQFAETEQVLAYIAGDPAVAKRLAAHWEGDVSQGAWYTWRTVESTPALPFKLYISPTLDALPEAFRLAVDALARTKCPSFKVGLTAYGLLRPDKLVAYFEKLEHLQQAAELILASATGIPAQGVPFTAGIDDGGLASWAMDPPRFEQLAGTQIPQSWRQWIADRLAVYIVAAKEGGAASTTQFALQRLAMDGVDTATWSPNPAIWRRLGGFSEELA